MYGKLKKAKFSGLYDAMRPSSRGSFAVHAGFHYRTFGPSGEWSFLAPVLLWWTNEALHGRRLGCRAILLRGYAPRELAL
jgi:hypothetical protein